MWIIFSKINGEKLCCKWHMSSRLSVTLTVNYNHDEQVIYFMSSDSLILCVTFCFGCSSLESSSATPSPKKGQQHPVKTQTPHLKFFLSAEQEKLLRSSPGSWSGSPACPAALVTQPAETLGKAAQLRSALREGRLPAHRRPAPQLRAAWGGPSRSSYPWNVLENRKTRSQYLLGEIWRRGNMAQPCPRLQHREGGECKREWGSGKIWTFVKQRIDLEIHFTCSPKIASWIHFNFCHFIPKLSQVETDSTVTRHERK